MFLFTHIEKCAGTSFNELLSLTYPRYIHITKNNYGGNETRNDLTALQYKKIVRYFPSGIGGHSIRPYLEFLPTSKRITFLRNPISRYISQYNHLKDAGWVNSIDEFLKNEFYYDFMTKKIAGVNDYKYAENLLSSFDFIGNVDEYNKSLNHLQDVLNIKLIGELDQKNKRNENSDYLKIMDLSPSQKIKVEENNQLDIKLYNKFVLRSSVMHGYDDFIALKTPSKLRLKTIKKLNKFKKEKIINPIRLT